MVENGTLKCTGLYPMLCNGISLSSRLPMHSQNLLCPVMWACPVIVSLKIARYQGSSVALAQAIQGFGCHPSSLYKMLTGTMVLRGHK